MLNCTLLLIIGFADFFFPDQGNVRLGLTKRVRTLAASILKSTDLLAFCEISRFIPLTNESSRNCLGAR